MRRPRPRDRRRRTHEALARAGRRAAGSGSGWAWAGRARCCARSATRSSPCAARSSPAPTARAASSPSPARRCARPACGSARRPSRTSSRYRERIEVDGRPIDAADFARLVARGPGRGRCASPARHGDPTEFELLTAVVFRWFAEADVDVALVEVGLGGRLDATHAWDGGVAAITNVALDHMDRLGPTIAAIAREKAAIIERGDLAVTGAIGDALEVVRRRARRVGAPLTVVEPAPVVGVGRDGIDGRAAAASARRGSGLRGRHQAANVAVADAILDALERGRASPTPTRPRAGTATPTPRWPGRLELLDDRRRATCCSTGPTTRPARPRSPRRSTTCGRSCPAPGRPVARDRVDGRQGRRRRRRRRCRGPRRSAGATVIATSRSDVPRALPASDLAARLAAPSPGRRGGPGRRRPRSAPRTARSPRTIGRGPIVVAGSLYLVGAVRAHLVDDPALRDPVAPASPGAAAPPPAFGR